MRRNTKKIKVGNLFIGGDSPITIQSMTNTKTENYFATKNQIESLANAGCEIIRVTVATEQALDTIKKLIHDFTSPLVVDIHFNHKLAIACAELGVSKVRINPSNIGSYNNLKEVAAALKANNIPVRIGVNGGSLDKDLKDAYGVSARALVESALRQADVFEKLGVEDIILSVKSSDANICYDAYTMLSEKCDYPLHIGVTEAGFGENAIIKSSAVLGGLLLQGIGDTLRVSISGDPIQEVKAGLNILNNIGIRKKKVEIISCPTCGRTNIPVETISQELDRVLKIDKHIKIAVMGCIVNGIGEGENADIGVAGGKQKSIIFSRGKQLMQVSNGDIISTLIKLAEEFDG